MKTISLTFILCACFFMGKSQNYHKGEQSIIPPSQVIIENYTRIKFGVSLSTDNNTSHFDVNNAATYLQVLTDNNGRRFHILVQLDNMGKLVYGSLSNNLATVFNRKERPMFSFDHCMDGLDAMMAGRQSIETAVNCIIARLEYCSN